MSKYRVIVEGSDFVISVDGGTTVRGFIVVRIVDAESASEAAATAIDHVSSEWAMGKQAVDSVQPVLAASEVEKIGIMESLRASETGYVFHPGE